jgi:hypothetical protein
MVMKVFICWSAETSMQIANFLRDWLPKVNQRIDAFISHEDIGKGRRWAANLATELEGSNFGLICLTSENLLAPWLHFEAGALSKLTKSRVVPVLYRLKTSDVRGPLADFQAAILGDKQEMLRVLKSINDASGAEATKNWERTFESLWDECKKMVDNLITQDKIQITVPINSGVLDDRQRDGEGFTYRVCGTLKHLPQGQVIWLLNGDGRQFWPHSTADYDVGSGEWRGRTFLWPKQSGAFINAVVAPPTSQQFFRYYQQYGQGKPLSCIPAECENQTRVWAHAPS